MKHLLVVVLAFASLSAVDVTGTWTGTLTPVDRDPGPAYVVLTQEGNALTGTAGPTADEQHPIHNGIVEKGKLSFDVHTGGGVLRVTLEHQGDELSGEATRERDGRTDRAKVALKRATSR